MTLDAEQERSSTLMIFPAAIPIRVVRQIAHVRVLIDRFRIGEISVRDRNWNHTPIRRDEPS
jgi:hypothetical protein